MDAHSERPLLKEPPPEECEIVTLVPPEPPTAPPTTPPIHPPLSSLRAGLALVAVVALFTANQWSRFLLLYVVDFSSHVRTLPADEADHLFMNIALRFDEAQYGLLASIGFAALFSLASLVAGRAVDRVDSRLAIFLAGIGWAAAMAIQGFARNFMEVFWARMLLGLAQAFCNPAAYTALDRIAPAKHKTTIFGVYTAGVYFGGALAALSIVLDAPLGWRRLSLLTAVVSSVLAVVTFLLLPPIPPLTGSVTQEEQQTILDSSSSSEDGAPPRASPGITRGDALHTSVCVLMSNSALRWLLVGSTLRWAAGLTITVWIMPFYRETYASEIGTQFALLKAAVNGIAGAASAVGGGALVDRLSQRDARAALWVPAAGVLLAIPFWVATIAAQSLHVSLGALFIEYIFAECWIGPTVATLQRLAPPAAQGLAQGMFQMLTLVGNIAPWVVGMMLSNGTSLPTLLIYSVPAMYIGAALAFLMASEQLLVVTPRHEERK